MSVRTEAVMGTLVTIQVVDDSKTAASANAAIERAFGWFREIEERCTRFSPTSELMQLKGRVGEAVPASAILFEAVRFALLVAEETDGAFDPTVGDEMAARGFNREYNTGNAIPSEERGAATWKDIDLDTLHRTITLRRPLTLDLGAVAKGLAVDTAVRELQPFENFAIDAGGDLYLGGVNAAGTRWAVGIRHPRRDGELIDTLHISDQAVCTSGDYERQAPVGSGEHHLLDPHTGASPVEVASVTVVAPSAMVADALGTAAFILGPKAGIQFLDRMGVGGLIFTPDLERHETGGLRSAA